MSNRFHSAEISVVVPLFNERDNIRELYARLTSSLMALRLSYELVLVDDGSSDETADVLGELHQRDARVVVATLSRNFGHQAAISAGIDQARGRAVIVMDGDLQDPPEVLGQFIAAWRQGYEIVYAVRSKRKEAFLKRCGYALFYRLLRAVSDIDIPLDSGDFGLMDRRVVEVLKQLPEKQRFVRGLRAFVGFRQIGIRYERGARTAGKSKYSFRQLLRLAGDGVVDFSSFPLRLITLGGLATAGVALLSAVGMSAGAVFAQTAPSGWSLAIVVALVMGAVQLISLGVVGEYIRRIFLEIKGRPAYIVRRLQRAEADALLDDEANLPFPSDGAGFDRHDFEVSASVK